MFNYCLGTGAGREDRQHLCLVHVITVIRETIPLAVSRIRRSGPTKGGGVIAREGKYGGCSCTHLTDTQGLLAARDGALVVSKSVGKYCSCFHRAKSRTKDECQSRNCTSRCKLTHQTRAGTILFWTFSRSQSGRLEESPLGNMIHLGPKGKGKVPLALIAS